jgi:ribosomal protein L29
MKSAEIREKGILELKKMLNERRSFLRKLRFDIATKQVKNHREYRNAKNTVAKLMTIISQKNIEK